VKVTRELRGHHRAAIIAAAARLFRERGVEGVGVAEITRAAGLTHGAFYGHFASKEALLAESLAEALRVSCEQLSASGDLAAYAEGYASHAHLRAPGSGCPIATLATEVARQGPQVRTAFAQGTRKFFDIAGTMEGDRTSAVTCLAQLVGAMVIARAVDETDPALASEVLACCTTKQPVARRD